MASATMPILAKRLFFQRNPVLRNSEIPISQNIDVKTLIRKSTFPQKMSQGMGCAPEMPARTFWAVCSVRALFCPQTRQYLHKNPPRTTQLPKQSRLPFRRDKRGFKRRNAHRWPPPWRQNILNRAGKSTHATKNKKKQPAGRVALLFSGDRSGDYNFWSAFSTLSASALRSRTV